MKTFITAIPLFNADMTVEAYRLCTRDGHKLFGSMEDHRDVGQALLSPALNLLDIVGVDPFAGDKKLFVDLNQYLLLMDMPIKLGLGGNRLICVLTDDIPDDEAILGKCKTLKQFGYELAFEGCPQQPRENRIFALCDYLLLDYVHDKFNEQLKLLVPFMAAKKLLISNVPDMQTFDQLKKIGKVLLTGDFYSQPLTKGVQDISPLKINLLRLLQEINQDDFELTEIAHTVEQDPSLSISLLRFINSAAVGLPNQIASIRSAVAILGQNEVRRWANVASSVQLSEDRPGEITKLSLVRAKFAENLSPAYNMGVFAPNLFLAGLFSLLDLILQKPMEQAIREVAVEESIYQALVHKSGPFYEVMDMVYAYERADWDRTAVNMIRNHVRLEQVSFAFVDALIWYKQLLTSMIED